MLFCLRIYVNRSWGKVLDTNGSGLTKALLDSLYGAATEPEMWPVFLEKATKMLRADQAAILIHAPENINTLTCADRGVTVEARLATERLTRISPWMVEILKFREQGWYCGSPEDHLPMEKFRRSKFYNEFFRKYDIEWTAAAVVFSPGGWMQSLSVARSRAGVAFGDSEKELLRQLVPHLERVFRFQSAINSLYERNAAGQHALDLMGVACITLDAGGRVLSANRRAEALIADGALLRIKERRLLAARPIDQKILDACLLKACACGAGKSTDPGEGATVLHAAEGRTLYVTVLPYHSGWAVMEGHPSAILFLTTPEEQGQGEHRLWQSIFGLSPAECRVAEMMKQGMEVGGISDLLRIKADTVRYYQKCIYRKTGVRGQGSMMRLLTRLPSTTP